MTCKLALEDGSIFTGTAVGAGLGVGVGLAGENKLGRNLPRLPLE